MVPCEGPILTSPASLVKRRDRRKLFFIRRLQGWAFAHFENEQSLIFALFKRAKERSLFLSLFLKEQLLFLLLFLKEQKSDRSFGHSFEKSEKRKLLIFCSFLLFHSFWKSDCSFHCSFWKIERAIALFVALFERAIALLVAILKRAKKSDRSFAPLQWAPKRAIAHLLFLKEQMSKRLLNRSFKKSGNEQWANEQMSKWAIAQPWAFAMWI